MSACATQETISAIITNACRTFAWGKRSDTWKTMLGYIRDIALEEYQLSLADLEASSLKLAKDMTREEYDTAITNYKWQDEPDLRVKFKCIPYIFCVGSDGIITVVFNEKMRCATCEIKEITKEMMELLKYLGLVRIYILEDTKLTIPFLPDNIIHLEINNHYITTAMDRDRNFSFPRFLRGLIDKVYYSISLSEINTLINTLTYTNRLPDTLIRLETPCPECANLPSNLVYYKLTRFGYNDSYVVLPKFELFPIGVESIIICIENFRYGTGFYKLRCEESIQLPTKVEYLKVPIGHILADNIVFSNIRTLCINLFYNCVPKCTLQASDYTGNLKYKDEFGCIKCGGFCEVFEHTTKIILEEGIEHLILDFMNSLAFLELIEYAPSSLTLLTINNLPSRFYETQEYLKPGVKIAALPTIPAIDIRYFMDYETYATIVWFQKKFPHVAVIFN
jgi:hypothetical protein